MDSQTKHWNFANTHFRLRLHRRKYLATPEWELVTTTVYSKWNSVCLFWHSVAAIHVILWREEPVTSCWFGQRHQTYILVKISLSLFGNQTNAEKQTRVSFHVFSTVQMGLAFQTTIELQLLTQNVLWFHVLISDGMWANYGKVIK